MAVEEDGVAEAVVVVVRVVVRVVVMVMGMMVVRTQRDGLYYRIAKGAKR